MEKPSTWWSEVPADIEINKDDLKDALARSTMRSLPPVAAGLAMVYIALGLSHYLFVDPLHRTPLIVTALISSAFLLMLRLFILRVQPPHYYGNLLASVIAIVALLNSLLHLGLTRDPLQTTNVMLVIVALGSFFLSWSWLAVIIGLSLVGWVLVVISAPESEFWVHFAFGLGLSIAISYLVHLVRLRSKRRVYSLRTMNETKQKELSEAYVLLEKRVNDRTSQLSNVVDKLRLENNLRRTTEAALKRSELALLAERETLAIQVDQQTAELRSTNQALSEAVRMKDEFLANMSHELRTPLNAILGSSEILQEEIYGTINSDQTRIVGRVESSAHHLLNLITDILDVSKIGAGQLTITLAPVSAKQVCDKTISLVRANADKKEIDLSLDIDDANVIVLADARRLTQILLNLLANAVKFTPNKGRVGLRVRVRPNQNQIHFLVWDTGIGIAQEDRERLFQPFVQLDASLARRYEGTGLGLALSQQLTELHRGRMRVYSQVGTGSVFAVTLPWNEKWAQTDEKSFAESILG